ncbi:MAG: PD-(D/E)XK nuclease family protein [Candidatus Eremiobacteraeota bacterium]|nr:PD-(D/E)XK nuclease family protein [Candidatus Eremiobacteraeota bacterium]
MADPFVEQLKRLCREQPLTAKWIILPSPAIGWTLGERLLHEGCNWVNLRFTTPFQLALEASAPGLLSRGIYPCPDALGPGLLQNLLVDLPDEGESHFRPLILQPGMAQILWETLSEFRLAGLRARHLDILPRSSKINELTRLFLAYEEHLASQKWADRADILAAELSYPQVEEQDIILPYPYCCWAPLEQALIERLPGLHWLPEATDRTPPAFWPPRKPIAAKGKAPQFFCAPRRPQEIDEILRRLEEGAIPLDQVEICALPEEAPLIQERLQAADFPYTFEAGLPARCNRAGQALNGLLTWVEHGHTAYHLRELLLSDLIRLPPNRYTSARLLQSARIDWGRESYAQRLQTLQEVYRQRGEQESAEHCLALAAGLESWWREWPAPNPQGEVPVKAWLSGLQKLLKRDFASRNAGEAVTCQAILTALEDLKTLPGAWWPLDRAIHQVRQQLHSLICNSSRPRPGHLHVTRPANLGLSGRQHLFLIGLEEGRWLTTQAENCVLDDQERAALHPALRLSRDLPEFIRFQLDERLETAAGQLTLSYSLRDRGGESEQIPSWIFFECARRHHPALTNFKELQDWLGAHARSALQPKLTPHALQKFYPRLVQGTAAEAARASDNFTSFDGFVPEAAGLFDPRQTRLPVSVSQLASLAGCPFQIFLEVCLDLPRGAPGLPDLDVWLDPSLRGIVIHDILADYHRQLRGQGRKPLEMEDRQLLAELLKQRLDQLRPLRPALSAAVEASEAEELLKDLEYFLSLELEHPERSPVALELPFGMGEEPLEPLASSEPVELIWPDGTSFALSGRIDRVDRLPGGYGVVDYKTGRSLRISPNTIYDRGRLLQHALYAMVVEKLVGPVVQSSYYFVRPNAAQRWVHFDRPDRAALQRVMRGVLAPLQSGAFLQTESREKDCTFCDYQSICEGHTDSRSLRKLENPGNAILKSRLQLLEEF